MECLWVCGKLGKVLISSGGKNQTVIGSGGSEVREFEGEATIFVCVSYKSCFSKDFNVKCMSGWKSEDIQIVVEGRGGRLKLH